MKQLTQEQQKLVTDNHNLIYSLANSKNIDLNEYYDVLAIGLCKAAITFDKTKSKFATYAYTCMYNSYKCELRNNTKESSIPYDKIVSLDVPITFDENSKPITFADIMPDNSVNVEKEVTFEIEMADIIEKLDDRDREILKMLRDGLTQATIAREKNLSRQYINTRIKAIRNLLSGKK